MASSTFPAVPPVLKPVQTVMKIASDLEKLDPVVAYWCRFYVVQAGLKIDSKSVESRTFLVSIMDWLEKVYTRVRFVSLIITGSGCRKRSLGMTMNQ